MERFFLVALVCLKCCTARNLPCISRDSHGSSPVACSATLYYSENCTDEALLQRYDDLYLTPYWPEKPHDLVLMPITEIYYNKLLPGFLIVNTPPRTGSIRTVKGFHIDFIEDGDINKTKCIVVLISNKTLDYQDRDNNLTFQVELHRLNGPRDYKFISWSLPKPPRNEKNVNQIRYGRTGMYGWVLSNAPADWLTTIAYYNNIEERYIRVWFIHAPAQYNFLLYSVTLEQIWVKENSSLEERNITETNIISKEDYTFLNVKPGRYRVLVQPYDDRFDSLDCRCKQSNGGCGTCTRTKTAVIVVPEPDNSWWPTTAKQEEPRQEYVLPSVLGVVSFILIVIVVIGCYKLRHITVNDSIAIPQETPTIVKDVALDIHPDKTVLILSADEDFRRNKHDNLLDTFSSLLEEVCNVSIFDVTRQPQYEFDWINEAVSDIDLVIVVMSSAVCGQINSWVNNGYSEPTTNTLLINFLKKVMNIDIERPGFGAKTILIKFPHMEHVVIPNDLSNKPMFMLHEQVDDFFCYICSEKIGIKNKTLPFNNSIKDTAIYRKFVRVLDDYSRNERLPSDDSGYVDLAFLPPSPILSQRSEVNSEQIYDQIERINYPNAM